MQDVHFTGELHTNRKYCTDCSIYIYIPFSLSFERSLIWPQLLMGLIANFEDFHLVSDLQEINQPTARHGIQL